MNIYLSFSAGRRGADSIDCITCGTAIHQRGVEGPWFDGHGSVSDFYPPRGGQLHDHAPAKEIGPTLGPFEDYVQITYDSIQHEANWIATYDHNRGDWIIAEGYDGAGEAYSDVSIYAKDSS